MASVAAQRPVQVFLHQAIREYRDKMMERLLKRPMHKPWMKYREIRIIEDILTTLRPRRALEWGVGFGTSHFARRLPEASEWIAVEHDYAWADRIRSSHPPSNVRIYTIPPEAASWSGDGALEEFRRYVEFPTCLGKFDFILVDGRARKDCLRQAQSLLTPEGFVVLHDANRDLLRGPWNFFPRQASFRDYRRHSGGLWIGSLGRDIADVFNLGKHRQIWRMYNSVGRKFRL